MAYSARILRDSMSPDGVRLTTFEVSFPRIVLAEFNTHRVLSRNSASSRAIPVQKMLARVLDDPFLPVYWGKNQKGMQADQELSITEQEECNEIWLSARDSMVDHVNRLLEKGVHKQIANRLLEPFMYHTVIVTATEWDNYFALRCNKDAQPEIRKIAEMMLELYQKGCPSTLGFDEWHLPLVDDFYQLQEAGFTPTEIVKICIGRCTRVSYLTHDGTRDPKADIELCERLLVSGHMSPFEHAAKPMQLRGAAPAFVFSGNFRGWVQARKLIQDEDNFGRVLGGERSLVI